jgi:hypothetical protein
VDLLPDDVTVYFLSHTQRDDEGHEKIKTMGKMLDEKITIEGLFTTVLKTSVQDGHYYFVTQNNGMDTVKSPIGMFDTYAIDNDLKYVDEKIRNYYNFDGAKTDEEITKLDEQVEAPEVEKPEPKQRRRGRPKKSKLEEKVEEITATPKESKPATEEKPKRRRRKTRTAGDAPLSIDDDTLPF